MPLGWLSTNWPLTSQAVTHVYSLPLWLCNY
jgi:hypothetical protein